MHGSFHICDRCDSKFTYVAFSDWYYDLGAQQLHIPTRPAWCFDCKKLRSAENLPTMDDCRREIDAITVERTAFGNRLARPIALEKAILRLQWRTDRASEPRCIWCGGTLLRFLDTDRDGLLPFLHPECGGTISFSSGFLGSAVPTLFSGEGLRLQPNA